MPAVNLETVRHAVETLRAVRDKKKTLKELEATAKAEIEEALGEQDTGLLDGEVVIHVSTFKRTTLDGKALQADHPEITASYMRTSSVSRMDIDPDEAP